MIEPLATAESPQAAADAYDLKSAAEDFADILMELQSARTFLAEGKVVAADGMLELSEGVLKDRIAKIEAATV